MNEEEMSRDLAELKRQVADLTDKVKMIAGVVGDIRWSLGEVRWNTAYALAAAKQLSTRKNIFEFDCNDRNVRLYLPYANSDWISQRILISGSFYEFEYLKEMVKEIPADAVVVDAGGNLGNHSVYFSMFSKAREIHVFEPQKLVFQILERNLKLNGCRNVVAHNVALGAAPGHIQLYDQMPGNSGSTEFREASVGEDAYPVETIDALDLPRLDFMKIDVEGAELGVLKGAEKTIAKFKPALFMELKPTSPDYGATKEFLDRHGYVIAKTFAKINHVLRVKT